MTEQPQLVGAGWNPDTEAPAPEPETAGARGGVQAWTRTDWKAAGLLAGVPTVIFSLAAAIGYPLITGDNLVQNYPLEDFAGQVIRHGHLPLYDAFLWSGTPLLGGTNAHALLPITLLFAVLPPLAAWVIGQIFVVAAAAIGIQLFLRRTGCGTLAAALGGATFAFGGFMSSQDVHIDFVAAAAALPWALVALHGLATRPAPSRVRHCLLLVVTAAWIALTGSPDIVIDAVVGCGAYLLHLLLQPQAAERRTLDRLRLCAWAACGGFIGIAVGALQWAPAAAFVSVSERANPNFAYISGGSLDFGNFLELLVPHVFGASLIGSGKFGGTFPLSEINAYPGTLVLAALFVMLVSWRRPDAWRWRVWLVVCGAAIILVSGDHTPFEHVIAALPIVGKQRLPNRALILFSLSASLLGAYFIDWLVVHHPTRRQIKVGLIPIAGVIAVVLATVITGKPAGGALVPHAGNGWTLGGVVPGLVISTVLAIAVGGFLLYGGRLAGRRRVLAITLLVLVDLVLADVNQTSYAPVRDYALQPANQAIVAQKEGDGRYLVVDPLLRNGSGLESVGEPDLGVIDKLRDAGGYSSLAWGPYADATGTHVQDGLLPSAITNGTLSQLGVTTLFAVESQVITRVTGATDPTFEMPAGSHVLRWFGSNFMVSDVTLYSATATPKALRQLGFSLTLFGYGQTPISTQRSMTGVSHEVTVHFPTPVRAMGLQLGGSALTTSVTLAEPVVQPQGQTPFLTAGPLTSALGAAAWVELGDVGGLATFVNPQAAPRYSVATSGAVVKAISSNPWTGGASVQVTTSQPTWLVRSVADVPGWRATVSTAGHVSEARVERDGLVQRVHLPAGTSTVTFFYVAPGWHEGQIVALGGAFGVAGLILAAIVGGRRRRRPRSKQLELSDPGATLVPA